MEERDLLADLRAWRDEFARSHGYDLAEMVATLREMDRTSGARVVRGEPRKPEPISVSPQGHSTFLHMPSMATPPSQTN